MATTDNKTVVLRSFLASHNPPYDLGVVDEACAPAFGERLKRWLAMERAAFPDKRFAVEDAIAEDDRVVLRWRFEGTHRGPFETPLGTAAPTGRRCSIRSTAVYRLEDGRIVEAWGQHDWLDLLQQMGATVALAGTDLLGLHRRYNDEVLSGGDLDLLDALVDEGHLEHMPGSPDLAGRGALRAFIGAFREAFPDAVFAVEDAIAAGDRLAARWTMRGTHRGPFGGVPATGRPVSTSGVAVHRFADGRMTESWDYFDAAGLLQQIGASPSAFDPTRD